jgi:FKBP-type peptidyl-prolyl cis-trans isomerase
MKKYFLLFSILIITLSACNKNQVTAQAAVDEAKIQAYMKANNIQATKDASGIYYQVITPGTGPYPIATSTIKYSYTGKYLNGQQFDQGSSYSSVLNTTVQGFQLGIPHINAGGRLLLIVPSALGYGSAGSGSIPANAVLVFTIDLQSFY